MREILLKATDEAQTIIEECLNGYNFGQTYSALKFNLHKMMDKGEMLKRIKVDAMQVSPRMYLV